MGDMREIILSCNKDGMEALRNGQEKTAFDQFKYAEAMLLANQMDGDNTALLAVTCNNLGCYYKKTGKFHGALSYFRRALKMENELSTDEVTLAGTHLNLCAVLSKLEKHTKAFQHALCALELMSRVVSSSNAGASAEDYTVLAVAYHNVGMEREFLGQYDQAATAFQNGFQVAKRLLGESHPLSLTLERNCEEVLRKSKRSKAKSHKQRGGEAGEVVLPPVAPGGQPPRPGSPQLAGKPSVHKEALDWVRSEEAAWAGFAQKTLQGTGLGEQEAPAARVQDDGRSQEDPAERSPPGRQHLASLAVRDLARDQTQEMPTAYDMGAFRFEARAPEPKKTRTERALDSHPEAIMEIVEAEMDGPSMKSVPNDFRPNRSMKRNTRTSHVVRRTGVFNSTTHRDRVGEELEKRRAAEVAPWKSAQAQKRAAERIQRVWRSWYQYCQENSEWMTITWICATMIQSHWRSYHVRRVKMDNNAANIQRHCRGFLVRSVLRSHDAAVAIQRHVVGMLTRKRLRELHEAATHAQRLVRGGLDRRRAQELRQYKSAVAVVIQKNVRVFFAKRLARRMAVERRKQTLLLKATLDLQRMFRGWKGRQLAGIRREEVRQAELEHRSATRIQSLARARKANRLVDQLRERQLLDIERAATFVRKVWLGARMRKKYVRLQNEFAASEASIITMQRYMRGCMTRLKLWREAVRTEEQLWAAVEIQRSWRGYRGRVFWEDLYEHHWRREVAAALLQRNMRGWHARLTVGREQRRRARADFERARRRFRAAQRIQAVARGVITRRATDRHRMRKLQAAVAIQRIARGHALRMRMWHQISHQQATSIQALARGFLVRSRRFHLLARVVYIQRAYRRWLDRSKEDRETLMRGKRSRQEHAAKIQRHWRQCAQHREIRRIQAVPRLQTSDG